jgi:DNA excision repair protein ERCC-3
MPQKHPQDNPLIVQSDHTLLLDVHAPRAADCRAALIPFAELERSPEHLHTYRLTPLSLWNACAAGFAAAEVNETLAEYARFPVPQSVQIWVAETAERFGAVRMLPPPPTEAAAPGGEAYLYLTTPFARVYHEIDSSPALKKLLAPAPFGDEDAVPLLSGDEKQHCFRLLLTDRGTVKEALLKAGWPVRDEAPLRDGEPLAVSFREADSSGKPLALRAYQKEAAEALVGGKGPGTGFGTVVLPCGSGKTLVGMAVMSMLKTSTLIITTNISAVHQWIAELLDKTALAAEDISEYSGAAKDIRPVTVATYQILTWRPEKEGAYPHFELFRKRDWGLIIYDEVHLLPAPVFRVVAELQAIRRLGLTATLVREDGLQGMVFSLVGPKRYDVPWKELEASGWIAKAECVEIRVDLPKELEIAYAVSAPRERYRIASTNPAKVELAARLTARFASDQILVIGQYLDQLSKIARALPAPLITGKMPVSERDALYGAFRRGEIRVLVVSKVANFAIDLPDASLAVQVSGAFGSRQEEAQRLGRILRPKERVSRFITLVTRSTAEEDFGRNRQKFLAEQGYDYRLIRYTGDSDLDGICAPRKENV